MARKSSGGQGSGGRKGDELLWLETYFILFPQKRRPTLAQVEHALAEANPHLQLENLSANEDGQFESLLVESAEDHAAVEVSYETGDGVIEQNLEWAKQLQEQLTPKQLQALVSADARLDLAHFERVKGDGARASGKSGRNLRGDFAEDDDYAAADDSGDGDDDFDAEAAMEIFDPTCLLTVVEALQSLTKGITIDPASGEIV